LCGGRVAADHDDTDAEYIATPSGHPTPEAAIDFIKQMIDSPSTTIKAPKNDSIAASEEDARVVKESVRSLTWRPDKLKTLASQHFEPI
jgi:hypothetical protein